MSLRLGIDIGTSGVRTAVINREGEVISTARAAHPPRQSEMVDAEDWWTAVAACLQKQVAQMRLAGLDPLAITGIAVDGTSGSMVLTDAHIKPVSPALMYNSKGFETEAAAIARVAPDNHIAQGSNSALARAMRLVSVAEGPAQHLLHQADFVVAKLTGRGGLSDHNNALKTGFDPETEAWPDWIGAVFDPALLPKPLPLGNCVAHLSKSTAEIFGLSPVTKVHAGTTDSIAAFLAASPLEAGNAVTSLGSTLAVKILSPIRVDDPRIGLYSHRLGDVWLAGGASNTGGAVLAHHFTPEQIKSLTERMDIETPTDTDYYPLLSPGERFPFNDPNHPPRLTPRPDEDHLFLQGMFEAMSRIEAQCYRAITERGGPKPVKLFTAGGGAANDKWTTLRAQALGITPMKAEETEASVGVARSIPL